MKKRDAICGVLLLFVAICTIESVEGAAKKKPFDMNMFVLQWDPELSSDFFTIHGIWPENLDGSFPQFCGGRRFILNLIEPLILDLDKVWPSNTGRNAGFWSWEWNKHGSCTGLSQLEYFQQALNYHSDFDMKGALAKSRITPSASRNYTLSQIKQAVKSNIGSNPAVHCVSSFLVEIALCFNATTNDMFDCPDNTNSSLYFYCPEDEVNFPVSGDYAEDSGSEYGPTPKDRVVAITFVIVAILCAAFVISLNRCASRMYSSTAKAKDYE